MRKVLTNLVLNACAPSVGSTTLWIGTEVKQGWVCLSVADNGCGMSHEFVENSLFRPFRSTKKDGLGIGLFQSRMIVEAHGGKIEVETEERVGTTFRVLLPVNGG
ncbi:MAG: sensor histidine kinase [Kiritimatiellia bacterium]